MRNQRYDIVLSVLSALQVNLNMRNMEIINLILDFNFHSD